MNKKLASLLTALICTATLSGCYFLPDEEEILEPPTVKASEVTYTTLTATKKDLIKQTVSSGTVASASTNNLAFEENGGTIAKVYVRPGDTIEVGTLVAELETFDLDYQIETQELYVERAKLIHTIALEKGYSQAEIDKAELDITLEQNELDLLYAERENAKLYSDRTGTISEVTSKRVGEYINAGEAIATVIDVTDLYIHIYPNDMTVYKVGMEVSIRFDSVLYDGVVTKTPTELKEDEDFTGKNHIEVKFTNEIPETSAVGNLADVILIMDKREDVIVVSNSLIKIVDGKQVVYVFKDNVKVEQEVEVGLQTGSEAEIISGLSVGDQIIIR